VPNSGRQIRQSLLPETGEASFSSGAGSLLPETGEASFSSLVQLRGWVPLGGDVLRVLGRIGTMGADRWGFEFESPAQWPGGCGAGWLPYVSSLFTLRRPTHPSAL